MSPYALNFKDIHVNTISKLNFVEKSNLQCKKTLSQNFILKLSFKQTVGFYYAHCVQ